MNTMIPAWVNGTLTPIEKLAAHRDGLRHKAVSVFVLHGSSVLIQQRALGKYHTPGLWANTCCTHPHWDEDPLTCANRRLSEEMGVTSQTLELRDQVEYRADVGGGLTEHEVVDIFIATPTSRPEVRPNPQEVMATRWVDLYDLSAEVSRHPDRFTPWLKIYLADHSAQIFGALAHV